MWDRLSLGRLLSEAGFAECREVAFDRSSIPGWERWDFDRSGSGSYALEPSVYVEARA